MTHKSYHIFTSFPHCYGSVMKPNVNPVTLISKKNIARVANFLFKVKLQALFCCLQLWQKETFSTHFFLGIIRVAVPLIIYFKKALKDYTVKLLYQRLGKHLDTGICICSTEWMFWKKWKHSRKTLNLTSCFNTINTWLGQN